MIEPDYEAWKEIRSRADSIANAVFLVSGGALSVSIAVLLGKEATPISESAKCIVSWSWYLLLYSIIAFLLVKGILLVQAYKQYGKTSRKYAWYQVTTYTNWILGISGLVAFVIGMILLVTAACSVLQ